AHEIAHCMFNHLVMMHKWHISGKVRYPDGTELPYIHDMMNVAMDLVINDMLVNCKDNAGKPMFKMPEAGCHDPQLVTENDSVVDAYKKVYKKAEKEGRIKKGQMVGNGTGHKDGFDQHLQPGQGSGKDPTQAAQDRNESEWQTEIAAAISTAK